MPVYLRVLTCSCIVSYLIYVQVGRHRPSLNQQPPPSIWLYTPNDLQQQQQQQQQQYIYLYFGLHQVL